MNVIVTIQRELRRYRCAALFLLAVAQLSCAGSRTLLISDSFDDAKNTTTFTMFPYGTIDIPGKWERTEFKSSSNQQFLVDRDSTTLIIGFSTPDRYVFYKPDLVGYDFVKELYEWDSQYLAELHKAARRVLDRNEERPFILYQLRNDKMNNYMLYGYHNNTVCTFVISSKKQQEEDLVRFLESLYLSVQDK